jgi:cytochrome c553
MACSALAAPAAAAELPAAVYIVAPPNEPPPPDDGKAIRIPGSTQSFTQTQILNRFNVADWFPGDHPAMPPSVKNGRDPQPRACGYCHTPTGAGRPENASLAGLPAGYIRQQVLHFRDGTRASSEPRHNPTNLMVAAAKAVSDKELDEAAAYFASLKPVSFVRVVESAAAPKTMRVGSILAKDPKGGSEPLAGRLVEVPDDVDRFEHRDPKVPFTAYVPVGSIAKGQALATTGAAGKTIACNICHGEGLKGLGEVPYLAGRSPSYIVRQLYDMQNGKRTGSAELMKQVVAKLNSDEMIAIAAYVATLKP